MTEVMRKVFRTIFALAVAAAALSACKKEILEGEIVKDTKVDFFAQSLETKTEFGTASGGTIPVLWQTGDKVKVMVNPASTTSGADAEVTPSSDFRSATFSGTIPEGLAAPYTFYVLSPSAQWVSAGTNSTAGEYIQYTIPAVQSPVSGNVDPNAQVLLARSEEFDAAPEAVSLTFKHFTAYGALSLTNLPSSRAIQSITLDFGDLGVAGRYLYKTTSDEAVINNPATSITLKTSETENVYFAIGPADISGTALTVVVSVEDGNYSKTVTVPSGKEFKAGVISRFSLDMTGAEFEKAKSYLPVTNPSALKAGDKIIIATVKDDYDVTNIKGRAAMSTTQNTHNRQAVEITEYMKDGKIVNPGSLVDVFTLEESSIEGTWLFKSANNAYIGRNTTKSRSSNNDLHEYTDLSNETTLQACSWSISIEDAETSAILMKANTDITDRTIIRANIKDNTYIFSCYKSGQDPICFFTEEESTDPTPEPKLVVERVWGKFSTASASWNEYYGGTPNTDRNVAMDDNYVYIAETRTDAAKLWAISIDDPSDVKEVNTTGVAGGFWPLACPRVINDANGVGYLMASNMNGIGETGENPRLYIWKDGIDAAPEAIELNCSKPYERIGDTFSFWGTYDKGMLLLASTTGNVRMWKFVNKILENGTWVNCRYIVTPKVEGVAAYFPFPDDKNHGVYAVRDEVQAYNAAIEDDADAWAGKKNPDDPTGPRLTAFNLNVAPSGTNYFLNATSFQYIPFNGKKYLAHTRQVSTTDGRLVITEGEDSDTWAQVLAKRHGGSIMYQAAIQEDAAMQDEYNPSPRESGHSGMDIAWREIDGALYIACVKQNVGLSLFKMSVK